MRPNRLAKLVGRGLTISWRDEPTQHDIAALDANLSRVGLVIKLRWVLVVVLAMFSAAGAGLYTFKMPLAELGRNLLVPGAALGFVLAYNTFYQKTYRRLGKIAVLNHVQLMFDVLVAGVLVYYSGGVYSWFHAMFFLFVLEGAFILPRSRDVWFLAAFASAVYSGILVTEYLGWLPHVPVPFANNDLQFDAVYVGVNIMWVLTVLAGTASISSLLMAEVRGREQRLSESVIIDETTGITNRTHFNRLLRTEMRRARRTEGAVGVIILDVDNFGRFNETFGFDSGNRILRSVAQALDTAVAEGGDSSADLATVCRYGGEEFAVVIPGEPRTAGRSDFSERVSGLAERLRERAAAVEEDGAGVTVSVGWAIHPDHGSSVDDILVAADDALARAHSRGGNAVCAAASEVAAGVE